MRVAPLIRLGLYAWVFLDWGWDGWVMELYFLSMELLCKCV